MKGKVKPAQDTDGDHAASELARREIADCDAKLRAHRAALEAGADPAIVAEWMAEVQAQRTVAEARLRQGSGCQRMTAEEITRVLSSLRDLMSVLAAADPADKAQI
jgi:site-specific DNA recombinase